MTIDDFPATPPARPIWLMTLADLALLLVGFFVFVQASQHLDAHALARGIREGFGAPATADTGDPMPVAAAGMFNFASGSAMLPGSPAGLVAWAREAALDPRVTLKVTGAADGSAADVDAPTGSAAILAADRARAVAEALAPVAAGRMTIVTADGSRPGRRAVIVTLGFAGNRR